MADSNPPLFNDEDSSLKRDDSTEDIFASAMEVSRIHHIAFNHFKI